MRFTALAVALLFVASVASASVGFFDDFNGDSLGSAWTVNNAGDYSVSGGNLNTAIGSMMIANPLALTSFTVPAPAGDFVATMKATCTIVGGSAIPNVGIAAFPENDQQSTVLLGREFDGANWGEFHGVGGVWGLAAKTGGPVATGWPYGLTWTFSEGAVDLGEGAFYLQIVRTGNQYDLNYSADGTNFSTFLSTTYTGTPLTRVGIITFGECYGGPQTAQIDSFSVVPEPATMSLLALGALGLLRRKKA